MQSQFALFKTRRFLPLFIVQFLIAFNDNLLKTFLTVLIAYGVWDIYGWDPAVLVAVAAGMFILPFILFCPLAGNLSDKYDKGTMIRIIKLAEIGIALAAVFALFTNNLVLAFIVLLALGTQSAFFSPCKFSILPQHLEKGELVGGNALITTGTYMAILLGTILGALFALMDGGKIITSLIILSMAVFGYLLARLIPEAPPPEPDLKISYNIVKKAYGVFRNALAQPEGVVVGIVGVSFFYFVAATFHAQFPNFTKQTLGADNIVLIMFMIVFTVGVAIGGLLNHKILNARPSGVWVPIACLFMGGFGIDIYFAALAYPAPSGDTLHDLPTFLSNIHGIRLMVDTFLQAVACGFYVVPLRAIVQDRAENLVRSRVISGSNMMDALFIFSSAAFSTVVLALGMTIEELYLTVSVMTVLVGLALFRAKSLKK